MKKLMLVAAVLLGGIAASQAGVSVNIGFGLPFPRPEHVVIGRPVSHCAPAPVVVAPAPVCHTPVVVAPACPPRYTHTPVVVAPPRYPSHGHAHGHYSHYDRRDDRHDHGRNDRDHRGWYSQNGHSSHSYGR